METVRMLWNEYRITLLLLTCYSNLKLVLIQLENTSHGIKAAYVW